MLEEWTDDSDTPQTIVSGITALPDQITLIEVQGAVPEAHYALIPESTTSEESGSALPLRSSPIIDASRLVELPDE